MTHRKMSDRRLNDIVEKAIEDAEDEISFREANGYPEIEQQVLQMALATASDLPGKERGVWELMSKEVAEVNVRLKRDGYPTVHQVPFDMFCKLLSGPVGDASVH